MLAMLAFLLIMFTPGIMSVFYLILLPSGFSDIHPEQKKWHETNLTMASVQQFKKLG